jgi:hypothetical protein
VIHPDHIEGYYSNASLDSALLVPLVLLLSSGVAEEVGSVEALSLMFLNLVFGIGLVMWRMKLVMSLVRNVTSTLVR